MDSKFRKPLFITVIAMIVITIFGIIVLLFNNQPQTESTTTENTNQTNEQRGYHIFRPLPMPTDYGNQQIQVGI